MFTVFFVFLLLREEYLFRVAINYTKLGCFLILLVTSILVPAHAFIPKPSTAGERPAEMWMSSTQLISTRGYTFETHEVRTFDGYLLTLHRIPVNRTQHGVPLLVGHGMGSSDEQWLLRRHDNLIYHLVDEGFDVWLANYRGSFYGQRHERLSVKSQKFWDFSWHENGVYDQAHIIDYVLAVTRRNALLTLGHSMSCTLQLVLLSEKPEYATKVLGNVLLAPPIFFKYPAGYLEHGRVLFKYFPNYKASSMSTVNGQMHAFKQPLPLLCFPNGPNKMPTALCRYGMETTMGRISEPFDARLFELMVSHYPCGASNRQVLHYAQSIMAGGKFQKYDYGPVKNKKIYGTADPPAYNLSAISSPLYVYYSSTDALVNERDVESLSQKLLTIVRMHKVESDNFNHIDFLISSNAYSTVYRHIIQDLLSHVEEVGNLSSQ